MPLSIERALSNLVAKLTGKTPTSQSIEGILEFAASNYTGGGSGKDGVGITSITGNIDGENNLTITINLTEGEPQVIKGKITPPAG